MVSAKRKTSLNPQLQHDGRHLILATRLIAAARLSSWRRTGSVADQGNLVTRAVDVLMTCWSEGAITLHRTKNSFRERNTPHLQKMQVTGVS